MKPFLILAALVAAAPALAQVPTESGVSPMRLSQHIKVLASDDFEGRGPGTAGETKTVAYLIQQMQALGLDPGGALKDGKRGWTQDVPLARSENGPLKLSLTAGGRTDALTQGEQVTIRSNGTGLTQVDIANAPLVFVGYGVKAPERNWDDFKGADLKGKIAVVLVNDPDFETGSGDFGGKAMTYYGRWTYKYEEAARQGALGVLVVHETAGASYGWATVKNSNSGSMLDIVRADPKLSHTSMEGWIQRDVTVDLFKRSGLDFEALKKLAQTRDFKPVALTGASFSASYPVKQTRIVTQNVAGLIPGAAHPGETVIYSGHWDHLGIGEPDARGDKIYNGAVDNADGIASILEVSRLFKAGPVPQRSVVFLAVTAEEEGLLGSEYYGANPLYPTATTVAVINMDAFDATGPARDVSTSGSAPLSLLDDLAAAAKTQGRTVEPDSNPAAGLYYRSDHFPFAKRGVPALSIESGEDLIVGGKAAGAAAKKDYTDNRYHAPADEWTPTLELRGVAQNADLAFILGRDLANSRKWPTWGAGAEFKALRDQTAAQRR
jgi:Zn-dependent M28 family amino/carboxypeptidase